MNTCWLQLKLLSDTTFGRGDGVAGLVDDEVQHDPFGLPYLHGKTLRGLLGATANELVFALSLAIPERVPIWQERRDRLFGRPGSHLTDRGILHVGDALLPADLRSAVAAAPNARDANSRDRILQSLTVIRRYTAMDPVTGAPLTETLRSMRLVIRDTAFTARLDFDAAPEAEDLALVAGCVRALRRAGSGRNRGRGRVNAALYAVSPDDNPEAEPVTTHWFEPLQQELSA